MCDAPGTIVVFTCKKKFVIEELWGDMTFFEGSEKKFEIVVQDQTKSLRSRGREFWESIVQVSGANILSEISNEHIVAYLLSESCLFVWDDRVLMITCGRTRLVESLLGVLERESVKCLLYQRKNEFRAKEQSSSFLEDVAQLRANVPGRAMRFGEIHGHHNLLFHSTGDTHSDPEDKTLEFLMYDISPASSDFLITRGQSVEEINRFFDIDRIFEGYQVDAYNFQPCGYSLNAIKDDLYYTIHITPEKAHSYASIETNDCDGQKNVIEAFFERLEPDSFDIMSFNMEYAPAAMSYECKSVFKEKLSIGYQVFFAHYFKKCLDVESPYYF